MMLEVKQMIKMIWIQRSLDSSGNNLKLYLDLVLKKIDVGDFFFNIVCMLHQVKLKCVHFLNFGEFKSCLYILYAFLH